MRKFVSNKLAEIAKRRDISVDVLGYSGFWGANNTYASGWLSQWHMGSITLEKGFDDTIEWNGIIATEHDTFVTITPTDNITLPSAEHCMMYMKAMMFKDYDAMANVIAAETPAEAKRIGRQVKNFDNAKWDAARYALVRNINYEKFRSGKGREILGHFAKTPAGKTAVFVETSPYDAIWGIKNRNLTGPELWEGDNLLGFALTDVYDKIVWGLSW